MTPLTSMTAAPAPLVTAASGAPTPSGTEKPAAAPPVLGARAVTPSLSVATAVAKGLMRADIEPLEIPPDPPPVKGLGIPGLNMARVGDFDKSDTPPPPPADRALAGLLQDVGDRQGPSMDLRL